MAFTSAREGRLWGMALAFQVAIYASLAFVRAPTNWLRERNLLQLTVGFLFLVAVIWVARRLRVERPEPLEIAVLLGFAAIGAILVMGLDRVEERVHLLEYGIVAGLIYAALSERRRNLGTAGSSPGWLSRIPSLSAMLLTALLGWGDEGIQALLPDRVYDLRDVALNVAGGLVVICALVTRRWVRARKADA